MSAFFCLSCGARQVILWHSHSYIASQLYFALQSNICLWQVILLTPFAVAVRSNTHFACSVSSYKSTHLFEDGIGGAAATTVASAKHQNLYAVAGALCFFCTKATSGIMRRRRLACARRVLPCPQGSAVGRRGKHVRKGDMYSCGISHSTCLYNS